MRQIVLAATAGAGAGVFFALDRLLVRAAGLPAILAVIAIGIGVYFASEAREKRTAVLAGALGGLMAVVSRSFLLAIINIFGYNFRSSSEALVMLTGAGALFGLIAWNIRNKRRSTTGQTFQVDMQTEDRRKLLSQLVEIQDRLRAGEQTMSFMSVDVVGSTAMKEFADPLAIEYTFGEYHEFVEKITLKYGGNIHSTAGDGVLCAFETPAQAFAAARNLQSGIFEVNTYRNKLGKPIALRIGIHHGAVVPQGAGLQSINFAHVIDVAAHLQKAAPEGGIAISTPAAGMLPAAEAMRGAETIEVQNVKALIWRPKSTPSAPTFETPPIPPTP
jgi:class 3 adenylate cyclase